MRGSSAPTRRPANRARAGLAMADLVVSLGACSLLVVSLGASLALTIKSTDQTGSPVLAHLRSGELADRVLADLTVAQSFTTTAANDVVIQVPSRDGDSSPDTIRYQWRGAPDYQLLRSYNGGPLTVFASGVEHFNLSYLTRSMGPPPTPPPTESAEMLLMQHDDAPSGSFSEFNTNTNNWCAQWFNPALSPDAIAWKITRVEFRARRDSGAAQDYEVQIREADPLTNQPSAVVLSSLTLATGSLPTTTSWITADLPDAASLVPETGYCLVFAVSQSATRYPRIQFEQSGTPMPSRTHWITTNNAGNTWTTPESTRDMRFRVYGTITIQPW